MRNIISPLHYAIFILLSYKFPNLAILKRQLKLSYMILWFRASRITASNLCWWRANSWSLPYPLPHSASAEDEIYIQTDWSLVEGLTGDSSLHKCVFVCVCVCRKRGLQACLYVKYQEHELITDRENLSISMIGLHEIVAIKATHDHCFKNHFMKKFHVRNPKNELSKSRQTHVIKL